MSRFSHRQTRRSNSIHKTVLRRQLKLENLEPRQLLTTAFPLPDAASDFFELPGATSDEMGPAQLQHSNYTVKQPREDGHDTSGKDRADRGGDWHAQLSPVVRNSIENGRDLSQYSRRDLYQATSWAVVTRDNATAKELFRKLRPKQVQDRTDLFGDSIRVHVWEVRLNRPGDYRTLVKLANQRRDDLNSTHRHANGTDRPILDVIPLFAVRLEPTGTLNPATVTDPNFPAQWHLDATANSTQWGIDAEAAWGTATGENVTIAIVDTRQHTGHPDLAGSFNAGISFDGANRDWNSDGIGDNNPNIFLAGGNPNWPNILDTDTNFDGIPDQDNVRQQSHGTAVAGLALGDDEGTGIVGVAPDANYAAFNFLEVNPQSIANTYSAANIAPIDVFNNSWGYGDTRQLRYGSFVDLQAIQNAATSGIFVKSAGNNRDINFPYRGWDRANYDQSHMRQTIVVAAAQQNGDVETYSNPGSNNLVAAPVNRTGNGNSWTSDVTDALGTNADNRGYVNGNVTTGFNGTSAAAPMVSGVIALMLETNPDLNWRNAQHILIDTAQKNGLIDQNNDGIFDGGDGNSDGVLDTINLRTTFLGTVDTNADGIGDTAFDTDGNNNADPYHTGWFQNAAGNWVSDNFGFGIVDANAAVQVAAAWSPVDPELRVVGPSRILNNGAVAEGNLGGLNSLNNIDSYFTESHLKVEWVEVTINATVADQDDLMLVLQSPGGTQSVLMAPGGTSGQTNINNFTFNTNQFWDETAAGNWTLQALDTGVGDGQASTINNWQVSIYGTCCEVSPLQVTSLANPFASLDNFADLALAAGGLEPGSYVINNINQLGQSLSMGVFSNGAASNLPLDQGLLFTSGRLSDAVGPNDKPDTSTNWNNSGHPLLNDLTGQTTFDASGLEIYFTPTENVTISYDFLYGSEEFDEWVGSIFNDGAGIFVTQLKSPTDNYDEGFTPVNIAQTFNGADLTVNELATNNKNGGVSGKYYNANPICGDMNWEYDGSSPLSQSSQIQLKAGANYYIGMMVADSSDGIYDSALAIGLDGSSGKPLDLFDFRIDRFPAPIGPIPKGILDSGKATFQPCCELATSLMPVDKDSVPRDPRAETKLPDPRRGKTGKPTDRDEFRLLHNDKSSYLTELDKLFEDFDARESLAAVPLFDR